MYDSALLYNIEIYVFYETVTLSISLIVCTLKMDLFGSFLLNFTYVLFISKQKPHEMAIIKSNEILSLIKSN